MTIYSFNSLNHTDELPSGDFDFEIYDIIFNHLSEELSCDFHALINRCGLGNLRNPNEGLWDFIVFDRDMAAKIIPILKNSDQFSLHGKIVGLPEYFATDYDLQDKKEAFSNAIDILLRHMRLVEKDSVLVFLLY